MPKEQTRYKGRQYVMQTDNKYFHLNDFKPINKKYPDQFSERLLHRQIWTDQRGPIPDGFIVHHLNGDTRDNRIENLSMMDAKLHASEHGFESWIARPVFEKTCGCGKTFVTFFPKRAKYCQDCNGGWRSKRLGQV